jgi:hypothetical protein
VANGTVLTQDNVSLGSEPFIVPGDLLVLPAATFFVCALLSASSTKCTQVTWGAPWSLAGLVAGTAQISGNLILTLTSRPVDGSWVFSPSLTQKQEASLRF